MTITFKTDYKIDGRTFDVKIDPNGVFFVDHQGDLVYAESFRGLIERISEKLATKKVMAHLRPVQAHDERSTEDSRPHLQRV